MITIEILRNIKHDGQQFHSGEVRIVTEQLGGYFCGNGWAREQGGEAVPADTRPKTLQVKNGQHGHSATNA